MAKIIITGPAKRDLQAARDWWAANRSREQAAKWYRGIHTAIRTLKRMPERCPPVRESEIPSHNLRELHFGLGSHKTHRIIFGIEANIVVIFACGMLHKMY